MSTREGLCHGIDLLLCLLCKNQTTVLSLCPKTARHPAVPEISFSRYAFASHMLSRKIYENISRYRDGSSSVKVTSKIRCRTISGRARVHAFTQEGAFPFFQEYSYLSSIASQLVQFPHHWSFHLFMNDTYTLMSMIWGTRCRENNKGSQGSGTRCSPVRSFFSMIPIE